MFLDPKTLYTETNDEVYLKQFGHETISYKELASKLPKFLKEKKVIELINGHMEFYKNDVAIKF